MPPAQIEFHDVGLRYGSGPQILRNISFRIAAGSFYYITGSSGAGKTSLLRLLYLGERPSHGRITLFGQDVDRLSRDGIAALRRQTGIVFQDFRLLPHLTIFDNVALPLRTAGLSEDRVRSNVTELLKWVGLGENLDAMPEMLSGGEQQRAAIARAIIHRPKIVLADEPTGNIDDALGHRLMHLFEELNRHGTTVIIATHDRGLIRHFPHSVIHLKDGQMTLKDKPQENREPAAPVAQDIQQAVA